MFIIQYICKLKSKSVSKSSFFSPLEKYFLQHDFQNQMPNGDPVIVAILPEITTNRQHWFWVRLSCIACTSWYKKAVHKACSCWWLKLWGMANVDKYNNNGGTLLWKVMYLQLPLYVERKIIVINKLQKNLWTSKHVTNITFLMTLFAPTNWVLHMG